MGYYILCYAFPPCSQYFISLPFLLIAAGTSVLGRLPSCQVHVSRIHSRVCWVKLADVGVHAGAELVEDRLEQGSLVVV